MNNYVFPIIMMGVTGSGKSALGALLASEIGAVFIDGDDLHPQENIDKMAAGIPLTDNDRWGWLDRVADTALANPQLVISCSALKHCYRQHLRDKIAHAVQFVFLDIPLEVSLARVSQREQHFMPASLVESQFAILERPLDEKDVITLEPLNGPNGIAATVQAIVSLSCNIAD
jgi:gluconokinase